MDIYVGGKRVRTEQLPSIGSGLEADVYDLGGGRALKLYKTPDHPDLAASPEDQKAAAARIALAQKKLRIYPLALPDRVVQPQGLAQDSRGLILGYTMPLITGAAPLKRYSQRPFREKGIDGNQVVAIFRDLHATVEAVHGVQRDARGRAQVVIGDANDLNVLVKGSAAYIIDADSFQLPGYPCRVFTQRFVDPTLCEFHPKLGMNLVGCHNEDSDWYAFAVMLFASLLYIHPYEGTYRPNDPKKLVPYLQRPLHRMTVFNPEVIYLKTAIPYQVLPDDLLDYYHRLLEKDSRGKFPPSLLENLRWTTCSRCGAEHARSSCPNCALAAPAAVTAVQTIRGKVTSTRIFATRGSILHASFQEGQLRWLYYEDGILKREGGREVARRTVEPGMRFRIQGDASLVATGRRLVTFRPGAEPELTGVDTFGQLPVFDASEAGRFWVSGGRLWMDRDILGQRIPEGLGDVLTDHTLIWMGPNFGFGFYRAGGVFVAFTFGPHQKVNATVRLPRIRGQLLDSTCVFTRDRCYFLTAAKEGPHTVHRCLLIRPDGSVQGAAEAAEGDGSWLGALRGKAAFGPFLLAPTDDGIVRLETTGGSFTVTRSYPDTEPFVDAGSHLFPGRDGIYVVDRGAIRLLTILP